jgi:CheY-like chemotaxis protein
VNTRGDVLIVDDDDDMREVVELVLNTAGYATRTAQNGAQALEAVAQAMPALILLDVLMPVMDGCQFAREFRTRYGGGVPIVIVTAAEHVRDRCRAIDVAEVLKKPFDLGELLRVVAKNVAPAPAHVS